MQGKHKILVSLFLLMPLLLGSLNVRAAQSDVTTSAQAAVLISADTGTVLYGKGETEELSMASTTKIMTALLALECAEETGNPVVEITEEMVQVEGSSMGLQAGDSVRLRDLAVGMLLASGNDAANSAAIYLSGSVEKFCGQMNARARKIGMKHTNFVTPSGLDSEEHYSTALDMALLAREALQNSSFAEIAGSQNAEIQFVNPEKTVRYTNHNKLLWIYEGCVGVKTGFTKKSGRCLVSAATRDGVTLVAVTLNAPDDWADHAAMLDFGFSSVRNVAFTAEDISGELPCVGGVQEKICVQGAAGGTLALPLEQADEVTRRVFLPRFFYAPIQTGDKVGKVVYYLDGKEIFSVSIEAAQTVGLEEKEESGILTRLFGRRS